MRMSLKRGVLPILSLLPVSIGIVDVVTVSGPGDQKMSAGMGLAFIFFPASFLLALISALITRSRWKTWPMVDVAIGVGPLLLLSAAVGIVILLPVLGL